MSCTRSGALTIAPTVCRGFSDEYGSWKIICTSRRSGRICPVDMCVMSRPSNVILPAVGASRRVTSRPVDDSDRADLTPQDDAAHDREVLLQPGHLEQVVGVRGHSYSSGVTGAERC